MVESKQRRRLPKTRRDTTAFTGRSITERDVKIIEVIARYRFILSFDIIRLVGGNSDVTYRHLQQLYHRNLISRTPLPAKTANAPFVYFLENLASLHDLARIGQIDGALLDFEQIRLNQVKYSEEKCGASGDGVGHLLFLGHEVMISQFRAELEIEAAKSAGGIVLEHWRQGPDLWDRIPPEDHRHRPLPFRPDAYFALHFPNAPDGEQRSHFFYEADRQTSNRTRFKAKLETYLKFFLRGYYGQRYGARRVRTALIETTSFAWMEHLRQTAADLAEREPLAGPLFWFTTSGLVRDRGLFSSSWSCAVDSTLRSLSD